MNQDMKRLEIHSHTEYSNIRLLDAINRPKDLINRAIDIGLSGICITDHETLSAHMKVNIYAQELLEKYPDFKIGLGNEIYLCPTRESGQKYYHFILIAKNKTGHRALRELSSRAWMNSYYDRGMERVVTLYSDLEEIVHKYPNTLIATTACLGGEISTQTLNLINAEAIGDQQAATAAHQDIVNFILWCKELFKDDFYIECAPGCSKDQIAVNKRLVSIAQCFNIPMVIGSDAHYLKKEDRYVHKAFLNSKGREREVDDFYEYAYLQDNDEIKENISKSIPDELDKMIYNSQQIWEKIENYSLKHAQTIPKVNVKDYPKSCWWGVNNPDADEMENYPILKSMFTSDDKIERYWVNQCWDKLEELFGENESVFDHYEYLDRLEEEADIKSTVGEKLGTNIFAYPVTLQHYVDLFWECGSIVGAGRGSSCSGLNHYLLGVTQLDPIQWDLPFFRYMNKDRTDELPDIDLDLCPSKRPLILKKIKEERGQNFNKNIDELSKQNLGCTLVATFGTESTKSAILTSCRGYRSKDYPDGIDVDTAQYMSSLVPSERGFIWSLSDMIYGNPDKDRKPVNTFIKEVNQYPGLLDIMFGIEGLISRRGSHASGVILFDEDPYEYCCFMKTPNGEICTQYDLHMVEAAGCTKYDFLVTDVSDKITETIKLLQKYNEIDNSLTLREVYNKYFHPSVLPIEDKKYWDALAEGRVLNVFQLDSQVGSQAAKKIKPKNIRELMDCNGLMRLMTAEKGQESPMDKYVRFKNNINLWYQEMDREGLTKEEQKILEPYFLSSYGVPPSQEQMMRMTMDPNICDFTLAEANAARKTVGKKIMSKIPELHDKVLKSAKSPALGAYVWKYGMGPQMGYAFNQPHALAYSFIGFQTLFIAINWNPIYWNTACLIVNSGSLETEEDTKEKGTDYAKMAKALGDIISKGIKVSLIDINKSNYSFEPDVENNQILFGMKALNGVGTSVIEQIMQARPYYSFKDFLTRCPLTKTPMISLIKAGAFGNLETEWAKELNIEPRILIMVFYLSIVSEPKKKLTLQNFNGLIQRNLVPKSLDEQKTIFLFNKYLKANKKVGKYYVFDQACEELYSKYYDLDKLNIINGLTCILQTDWDKIYQKEMDTARDWLKENQKTILKEFNELLFLEYWDKYAKGSISAWEMESLCFYYHEHELAHVNISKYGLSNFFNLPEEPEVDYFYRRNGKQIPIFKLTKIVGTVISKNDTRSSITILTTEGIVDVKFTKDYYAMYNRQISELQEDGTKKIMEKGWFTRGTKVMITGFRRDDMFVAKSYSNTSTHQLYQITDVDQKGNMTLIHERYGTE